MIGFKVGQVVSNSDIVSEFKCGNMGGMRRSKRTNTLVLISDHTKGLYEDKWYGDILHYTGMGKKGDQDRRASQNKTLDDSRFNGVDIHLFEVLKPKQYTYHGLVALAGEPYEEYQPDEDGKMRKVWMFPLRVKNDLPLLTTEA
ncbi:MAG: HNH endonuclease [Christensenellales bacterium]|jgi:5-methylcytosine-specific restriction protein A